MKQSWTVARRELRALFDHPTGYVLLIVFLAINDFLYFRQAYVAGAASLRPMLDMLPWLLLFFVPAVCMRSLAEDTRSGLLEVVLSQPLSELELLLGKYFGAVLFLWLALALTLPIPLGLAFGANLQWGAIVAQYVGSMLLAAGLAGVGVWASALARSQITAFIVGVAVMFLLVLVGLNPLLVGLPPGLGAIAARIGVLSHFDNISRGVIDLRDAVYFGSLAGIFLMLAYGTLMARKLAPAGGALRRLRLGVTLLVAALVVVNLLGSYIGGRIDLTPGKSFTLSPATKQIAAGVPDIVTIKVFASEELPSEVALLKRDVDDLLGDIRAAGKGKIRVVEKDPAADPAATRDAQTLGIQAVQFNVVGKSELQVKQGYFGLAVQYADGVEAIPFIQTTEDLEYRLASAIRSLTRTSKPAVGIVESPDPRGGPRFEGLRDQLRKTYQIRTVAGFDSTQLTPDLKTLILSDPPDSLVPADVEHIVQYLQRGGSALVMASGTRPEPQMPLAQARPVAWNAILKPFGVKIQSDMVYDLMSNQVVPLRTSGGQVLQPYPLWLRARPAGRSVITEGVNDVFLPWTSSIDTIGAKPGTITPLLITSRGAAAATAPVDLDPSRSFPPEDLKTLLLSVAVSPPAKDSTGVKGRLVVVGNTDFASDRYATRAPEVLAFALNAVDWLSQDEALIAIRSRDRRPPPLLFSNPAAQDAVKYMNLIGLPALLALVGALRLTARRRRSRDPYRPLGQAQAEVA